MKNFGKIKNTFHEILAESLLNKDNKKKSLFKQYLKLIKENKILKTQYLVYENIESKVEDNESKAFQYIQENIELLKQFKKEDILEANEKLIKLIKEDKYPQVTPFITPRKINVGDKIQVGINSGVDSGNIGIVVNPREVKTDGTGKPMEILGTYKPIDWSREIVYRDLNGRLQSMFKNRVTIIPNDIWEKIISDKENIWDNFKRKESNNSNSLYESITNLIFTNKTAKNIDSIIECQSQIVDYIKNNKKKEVVTENKELLPNSLLAKLTTDRFNEKYADLDESDKQLFKTILEGTEESKKELQENTIKECITLIDNQLKESDLEVKEKLLKAKDKLLNMKGTFVNENFLSEISKLTELKKDLLQ